MARVIGYAVCALAVLAACVMAVVLAWRRYLPAAALTLGGAYLLMNWVEAAQKRWDEDWRRDHARD